SCLRFHALDLVAVRINPEGIDIFAMKILNEASPGSLFFDQQTVVRRCLSPASMLKYDSSSQIRILEGRTDNIEDVDSLATHQQDDADREFTRCRVPADDQAVARTGLRR